MGPQAMALPLVGKQGCQRCCRCGHDHPCGGRAFLQETQQKRLGHVWPSMPRRCLGLMRLDRLDAGVLFRAPILNQLALCSENYQGPHLVVTGLTLLTVSWYHHSRTLDLAWRRGKATTLKSNVTCDWLPAALYVAALVISAFVKVSWRTRKKGQANPRRSHQGIRYPFFAHRADACPIQPRFRPRFPRATAVGRGIATMARWPIQSFLIGFRRRSKLISNPYFNQMCNNCKPILQRASRAEGVSSSPSSRYRLSLSSSRATLDTSPSSRMRSMRAYDKEDVHFHCSIVQSSLGQPNRQGRETAPHWGFHYPNL